MYHLNQVLTSSEHAVGKNTYVRRLRVICTQEAALLFGYLCLELTAKCDFEGLGTLDQAIDVAGVCPATVPPRSLHTSKKER